MTLKTVIKDGTGTGNLAGVSNAGELTVNGFPGATSVFNTLNVANTAFNFFKPKSGQKIMITSISISATTGPIVSIYTATSATTVLASADKTLIGLDLPASGGLFFIPFSFGGGFLEVDEGEFVNASSTTNSPIQMTIIGFYKPAG
jgi:hypothetical protein